MPSTIATRRDVVLSAVHHQDGRVPIDFGSTAVTGIHASCVAALREHYGLEKRPVKIHEPFQMLGLVEEDLQDAMGIDVTGVFARKTMFGFPVDTGWKPWKFNGLEVLVPLDFNVTFSPNGDTLIYPEGDMSVPPSGRMPKDGYFFDAIIRQKPIEESKLNPEDNLEEFTPASEQDIAWLAKSAKGARASGRAVLAGFGGTALGDIALVPAPFLKDPKGIRDVAEWYMSTRSRRGYIHKIFEHQCEVAVGNLQRIHAAVAGDVDAVFTCGTDLGTQTSAFCSVPTFRELYFPYYKQINDWIHRHTNWKVFKHSCGSVERFIDSFIECGFDILNPVQCSATGMDAEHLKERYGSRMVFWGGGVDTQKVLPFGTPAEIREQVLRRCEVFSKHGGFVFCSIHNVQARTPVENMVAMINAVHEFNGVPAGSH
jgi:uroporphyrinogen-III decarboxylase